MADFRGGRGKKTGYETQMYRIPSPLRPTVEKLGMQFRLLWDGVSDPKGEKLISRIETAIPDLEQVAESNGHNQISGNGELAKPDSKYEDEDELDEPDATDDQIIREQADKNFKLLTENRILERELATKEALCNDLLSQKIQLTSGTTEMSRYLTDAHAESDSLRLQLADIKNACTIATEDANRWNQLAVERLAEIEQLRTQLASCRKLEKDATDQLTEEMSNGFKAADILKEALALKANAGGEIKKRIREALQLIDDL